MRLNRTLLAIVLLVPALVLQVSILARLQLPGAVPDLLLLTVLGLALVYGHVGGALVGFAAGLLADLSPPADHAVGRYALVLCLIGYLAGLTRPETGRHRSAAIPMAVVAGAAVASTLLYAGVGTLVGDTAADTSGLIALVLTATLYDLLLAPFVVPGVMALARRFENDPLAGDQQAPSATDSAASWGGGGRRGLRGARAGRVLGKPLGGTGRGRSPLAGLRPRRGAGAVGLGGVKVKGVKRL
ncbi:rod shape-determining protein MreD [Streptomyces sp. ST2-7A]|uniref:rod shape-determining protein MreD n=1 Tax=Streptomyces sp. ST2-7A TaxID=2907214 RepID=UPI001F1FF6EF|nr:rod shape-determining protein MreD [Streptomyces sp. ST2-7A]MCE7079222.1 rod shape-determining protein MreD [Streptomyces sp. ST2-7A]